MCVSRECPSPSFALINQDTIWTTRDLKAYLLEHHSPVPEGQFNDTSIRVPTPTKLCPKKNCPCPKTLLQNWTKRTLLLRRRQMVQKQLFILSCGEMTLPYSMCLKHKLVLLQLLMIEKQVFKFSKVRFCSNIGVILI